MYSSSAFRLSHGYPNDEPVDAPADDSYGDVPPQPGEPSEPQEIKTHRTSRKMALKKKKGKKNRSVWDGPMAPSEPSIEAELSKIEDGGVEAEPSCAADTAMEFGWGATQETDTATDCTWDAPQSAEDTYDCCPLPEESCEPDFPQPAETEIDEPGIYELKMDEPQIDKPPMDEPLVDDFFEAETQAVSPTLNLLEAPSTEEESPVQAFVEAEYEMTKAPEPAATTKPSEPQSSPANSPSLLSPKQAPTQPFKVSLTPPTRSATLHVPTQPSSPPKSHRQHDAFLSATSQPHPKTPVLLSRSPRSRFVEPPPPHMPQAHFFGLPSLLDLGGATKPPRDGKPAGSDGYCCVFDTFADSGDFASSKKAKDALLVGSEGGLDVYRILPNKLEIVGHLEGLRGGVIGAKILPHTDVYDAFHSKRPLVALITHGPTVSENVDAAIDDNRDSDPDTIAHFQTTVEVYSLGTQHHISTLYKSTVVPVKAPSIGQLTSLPGPIGGLRIAARGKFVVVASDKSGELFIFSAAPNSLHDEPQFRCIGKYWTSLQIPLDNLRPSSSSGTAIAGTAETSEQQGLPLFTIGPRWLVLVSPKASLHNSILGSPLLSEQNTAPVGLGSHVAPPPPTTLTCDIAGVDEEGTFGRLTRQAAQGIVKYSQRGIEIGWQGWRELTNPANQPLPQNSGKDDQFPPTNATPDDPKRLHKEPAIVCLIDMERLLEAEELRTKYPPLPLASFALTEGCNFLSLSSSGLRLLTVSRKGDTTTIWDLTHVCHGAYSTSNQEESDPTGPYVKHIFRIPRSSQAIVVDAAWSEDDDLLALLTNHGTIHLHDIPLHPSPRKRKRRSTISQPVSDKAEATVGMSAGISPPSSNSLFGTIKSSWQQVSTGVNSMRSQSATSTFGIPTTLASLKEATASAGQVGGRLVAKGLSQGYSAAKGGASDYWHADDNKIRHRALATHAIPGVLRWIRRPSGALFAVVAGGVVHLHSVVRTIRQKGDTFVPGLRHERGAKHFTLQYIQTRDQDVAPKEIQRADDCAAQGPHGFWTLRATGPGDRQHARPVVPITPRLPMPPNDVETNPPYCPFHVDPRVNIYAFEQGATDPTLALLGHTQDGSSSRWVFGGALPPSRKMNTHDDSYDSIITTRHNPHSGNSSHDEDEDEGDLAAQVESRLTVHTTVSDDARGHAQNHRRAAGTEEIRIHTRRAPEPTSHGVAAEADAYDERDFFDY